MSKRNHRLLVLVFLLIAALLASCSGGGGIPTCTVTYNGNGNAGGNVPIDLTNYEQGQTVTVLDNTGNLVKTGASFGGWNTLADGSGTFYIPGQTFTMGAANVTLYAIWPFNVLGLTDDGANYGDYTSRLSDQRGWGAHTSDHAHSRDGRVVSFVSPPLALSINGGMPQRLAAQLP
ncbi:MAG TPA: InlB B-repeat-containing protein [Nitrospirota bacterium]|nr:InlB B-repeat-containing protein [Nitrospirota bacterium]